jgi:hypothetical protein
MALKPIRRAIGFLSNSENNKALLAVIDRQRQLLQAVCAQLPPPLNAHCQYAKLDEGELTLVTDSPAWASRLRFHAPELLSGLADTQGTIKTYRVRVQPLVVSHRNNGAKRPRARLSPATRVLLLQAAEAEGDTELGRALSRLAGSGDC